jgi:hypothetical protein
MIFQTQSNFKLHFISIGLVINDFSKYRVFIFVYIQVPKLVKVYLIKEWISQGNLQYI